MSRRLKIIILVLAGMSGLLVLVAAGLLLFIDAGSYRPRIEAAASKALGMEVRIDGRPQVGFFPGLTVTLTDVHVRRRGADLLSAKEVRLRVGLMFLLRDDLVVKQVRLKDVVISVERARDGAHDYAVSDATIRSLPAMSLARLTVSNGTLRYDDMQSGTAFEARNCSVDVRRLQHPGGATQELMKRLSATLALACGEFRRKDFTASDVKFSIIAEDGVVDIRPITVSVFGAEALGDVQADFSGAVPGYEVHFSLAKFRVGEFFKLLSPRKVADGQMDFSARLSMQGKTVHAMKRSMTGVISLRGKNLSLIGRDVDRDLANFESSQNFNLIDVGAFFFAGPLGLVATKGYNFAAIFRETGGNSDIRVVVSDWKVEDGVAHAQDVAMATGKNRIALHGGLDFVNERFDDVIIALVDGRGCARVRQRVRGTFKEPAVEQPGLLQSLAAPAVGLLRKGADLVSSGDCNVFYAGSVAPPT